MRLRVAHLIGALCILALLPGSLALASEQSPACMVQKKLNSARIEFENQCAGPVTVLYCSTTRKVAGAMCGEQKSAHNPYYTNLRTFKPGEKYTFIDASGHKFAVCAGALNSWGGLKGEFSSTADGDYDCKPDVPRLTSNGTLSRFTSTETATDIGVACERAQSDVRRIIGKAGPCNCKLMSKDSPDVTPVYRCTSSTDLKGVSEQALQDLKGLKSDASAELCPPNTICRSRNVATGVRG